MPRLLNTRLASRLHSSLWLGLCCSWLGAFVGALEGRWIASRDFIPLTPFSRELLSICLAYLLLLGGLGALLGLARKWKQPERVLCGLAMACAIWVLPYQSSSFVATAFGLAIVASTCSLYLLSSSKLRGVSWTLNAFVLFALLAGYPASEASLEPSASQKAPNIVLVVIDTLRADALSPYNAERESENISPVLAALAQKGTRFDKAYAQAPWTRPSTASLFTGLYPASHGIVTPFDPLDGTLQTMASVLKKRGYQTVGFSANPQVSAAFGFHNGFDRFWNSTTQLKDRSASVRLLRKWGLGKVEKQPARGVLHSTADDVNLAVKKWVDGKPANAPTFLYVHYLDPHDPYTAPEDLLGQPRLADVEEAPLYASQELPPYPLRGSLLPEVRPLELRELRRRYDTEIRFVDDRLGKMLERLRANGIWSEEDYLIITSDHGEEFYEHRQWQHGRSLFEEMIRVPLVVVGPTVAGNHVAQDPVELVDVLPTVAAWTGGPLFFEQHGENLFGDREKLGAFSHRPREQHPIWSLRVANQKVIWIQDGKEWLKLAFDLSGDPHEVRPLDAEGGEPFFGLHERLTELIESSSEYRREGVGSMELSESDAQGLEQLGYIDGTEE